MRLRRKLGEDAENSTNVFAEPTSRIPHGERGVARRGRATKGEYMQIRWDEVGRQRYEDMVSVLLSRLYPDAQRIDGSGGDGGRDVQIVHGQDNQIVHAFELKSFTGRVNKTRRRQVIRSLKRAAGLEPSRWTLVVPIDPTPDEDKWFRRLGKDYCFPIPWLGKTWLDEKMSAFPDIRRYFLEGAKDEVFYLLRELREEQARVTDVHDVVGRFRTLHARLNEIDPHYRYELSTGTTAANSGLTDVVLSVSFGDGRIDVYPKYSGAVEDRPITIYVKVVIGQDDNLVQNALNYGLGATIPPSMVSSVTVDAPSGLGGSFTETEISLLPSSRVLDEPIPLALDIMDEDRLVANWPIHLTERTAGLRGSILTGADSTGWLQTRLRVDVEAGELEAKFWLDPKPAMPAALVPLFRWVGAFQPPHCLAFRWPSGLTMSTEIQTPFQMDEGLGRVVEALAYLQDRRGIYWEMSPSFTPEEGQKILTAATLLKGESIDFTWKSLNLSLDHWGPGLEEVVNGCPRPVVIEQDMWLDMDGEKIPIGLVRTHIESARLADPGAVQRAMKSGLASHLRLVPGDSDKARRVVVC